MSYILDRMCCLLLCYYLKWIPAFAGMTTLDAPFFQERLYKRKYRNYAKSRRFRLLFLFCMWCRLRRDCPKMIKSEL